MSLNTSSPRDGAHVRRWRLLDIITYVHDWSVDSPCTIEAIAVFMTLKHGLTRQRTQQYCRELELGHVLGMDRNGSYKLRQSYERVLAYFAGAGDPERS
jgi:hypothetical protein